MFILKLGDTVISCIFIVRLLEKLEENFIPWDEMISAETAIFLIQIF